MVSGVTQVSGLKEADTLAWVGSNLPPNGNTAGQTTFETSNPDQSQTPRPAGDLDFEAMFDADRYYRSPTRELDDTSTATDVDPPYPACNSYNITHQTIKESSTSSRRSQPASTVAP
jgi:hypothetical protein